MKRKETKENENNVGNIQNSKPICVAGQLPSLRWSGTSACLSLRMLRLSIIRRPLRRFRLKVHLRLGETTLAKALREVSKQTGLRIQPAEYLEDRDLVVELDNMSAKDVLDTLAEGNDWIWYETSKSRIMVARPKLEKTQNLLERRPPLEQSFRRIYADSVGVDVSEAEIRSAFRRVAGR